MNKKKGVTLVEVMVAIVIFTNCNVRWVCFLLLW